MKNKKTIYNLITNQITSKFKKIKKSRKKNYIKCIKYKLFIIIVAIILFGIKSILLNINIAKYNSKLLHIHQEHQEKIKKKQIIILNRTEIIDNYLSSIPIKYEKAKKREKSLLTNLLSLKDISNSPDDNSTRILKSKLLNKLNKFTNGKNFAKAKAVFLTRPIHFGNNYILVNIIMYYCEIYGIKNIYFDSRYNWFLKNNITSDLFNISVVSNTNINCKDINIVCLGIGHGNFFFFYYPSFIKPQIRIQILKNEIRKNVPKILLDQNDLIIHIRSGNIFRSFHRYYSQPPLCFYKSVLNNFTFKNIYLIAVNKRNPVINHLLNEFRNIIYHTNTIAKDIAYLINAYNLVGSVSSFLMTTIKFNDNLKNYWDYDIYRRSEKICHLNVEYYDFPRKFKIYQMKPSLNYKNEMFMWRNDPKKLKLMIIEKCINNFTIIEPNI